MYTVISRHNYDARVNAAKDVANIARSVYGDNVRVRLATGIPGYIALDFTMPALIKYDEWKDAKFRELQALKQNH